jgi:predicted RND superfamily exporter protein
MSTDKQLARFDSAQFIDILSRIPNLTEEDRRTLSNRIASDDAEIRKSALDKMAQSAIAQNDLAIVQGELAAISKHGMYIRSKQTIKTGSGTLEVEMKGGDTKLIIPVLVIVGIVVIAALVIVFWK